MQAAIWACKAESPKKLVLALPVAPPDALKQLAKDVDETVCLCAPANFRAISQFYTYFEQVEDEQIIEVLKNYSKVTYE
jgi:predicted phosphoribosyltransferase